MRAARTVDGTSKGRIQRAGWICATRVPYWEELSVGKKQDTYIEETLGVTTERHGFPPDAFGANIERETIK